MNDLLKKAWVPLAAALALTAVLMAAGMFNSYAAKDDVVGQVKLDDNQATDIIDTGKTSLRKISGADHDFTILKAEIDSEKATEVTDKDTGINIVHLKFDTDKIPGTMIVSTSYSNYNNANNLTEKDEATGWNTFKNANAGRISGGRGPAAANKSYYAKVTSDSGEDSYYEIQLVRKGYAAAVASYTATKPIGAMGEKNWILKDENGNQVRQFKYNSSLGVNCYDEDGNKGSSLTYTLKNTTKDLWIEQDDNTTTVYSKRSGIMPLEFTVTYTGTDEKTYTKDVTCYMEFAISTSNPVKEFISNAEAKAKEYNDAALEQKIKAFKSIVTDQYEDAVEDGVDENGKAITAYGKANYYLKKDEAGKITQLPKVNAGADFLSKLSGGKYVADRMPANVSDYGLNGAIRVADVWGQYFNEMLDLMEQDELKAKKNAAKGELSSYRNAKNDADYRAEQVTELDNEVEAGNKAIDEAASESAINDALKAAKEKIDAVKTDAQQTKEDLQAAKEAQAKAESERDAANKELKTIKAKYAAPAKTKISKAKSSRQSVKLTWKKITKNNRGYQIRYSLKKNMKSSKTVTINTSKTTSKTIKKLASGKKYYFQIRSFRKAGSNVYIYSGWSAKKTAKVK